VEPKHATLPDLVVGPTDITRLKRELEALDNYLRQATLRQQTDTKLPKTSRMLDEFVALIKLDLLQAGEREQAAELLQRILKEALVVHISFATDPSSAFVTKIVSWFRQNIHPLVLVQVGLQPSIAAGCVVRTADHQYDLSLRKHFAAQQPLLIEKLQSMQAT
jgi:hypothetical protein